MIRLSNTKLILPAAIAVAVMWLSCGDDDKCVCPDNLAPCIDSLAAEPDTFYADTTTTIVTVFAHDPDGDGLHYEWNWHGDIDMMVLSSSGNAAEMTNCCPVYNLDSVTIISTVSDGRGGQARDSMLVWILP